MTFDEFTELGIKVLALATPTDGTALSARERVDLIQTILKTHRIASPAEITAYEAQQAQPRDPIEKAAATSGIHLAGAFGRRHDTGSEH